MPRVCRCNKSGELVVGDGICLREMASASKLVLPGKCCIVMVKWCYGAVHKHKWGAHKVHDVRVSGALAL